jgi:hypothetical protein
MGTYLRPCSAAQRAVRTHLPEKRQFFGKIKGTAEAVPLEGQSI